MKSVHTHRILILILVTFIQSAFAATFTVTNSSDVGLASLRQAIEDANASPGADDIVFVPGFYTITLSSNLPDITGPINLLGPLGATPSVEIIGNGTGRGLEFPSGASTGSYIRNIRISGHSEGEFYLNFANNITIVGCVIGEGLTSNNGFTGVGIYCAFSSNITIGGSLPDQRNIISRNSIGIDCRFGTDVFIQGNRINRNGSKGINSLNGNRITIGGAVAGAGNDIFQNLAQGIHLNQTVNSIIENNNIGSAGLTNNSHGIMFSDGSNTTVVRGNTIGANLGNGIEINSACFDLTIQSNKIGVSNDGVTVLTNGLHGISISGLSHDILIGGTILQRNIISGNTLSGINIENSTEVTVQSNFIGTDITGSLDRGNGNHGILVNSNADIVLIGGDNNLRNVISGNTNQGINIATSTNITIQSNLIGTDSAGTVGLGNGGNGIFLGNGASDIIIGGTTNKGNVISGNSGNGINFNTTSDVTVQSNYIGTNINGSAAIANIHGIQMDGTNTGALIGGSRNVEGNLISGNRVFGIYTHADNSGLANSHFTRITGNIIGVDITATYAIANIIGILVKSNDCTIGTTTPDEGNIIGGNTADGILIANGNRNSVEGNFIGTRPDGLTMLGNEENGIRIATEVAGQTTANNIVRYNYIAFNTLDGVHVGFAGDPPNYCQTCGEDFNTIRFNRIYCNGELGISLFLEATNDANRGNEENTPPSISTLLSTNQFIRGTPKIENANEIIDIYEMDLGCGDCDNPLKKPQGRLYVGSDTADANGAWSFDYSAANGGATIPVGMLFVATATNSAGSTSEFSPCCLATVGSSVSPPSGTNFCTSTLFDITYSNGLAGDSVVLQRSLDNATWVDYIKQPLLTSMIFEDVSVADTTYFRFITYSGGVYPTPQCSATTSFTYVINAIEPPLPGTAAITSPTTICRGGDFDLQLTGYRGTIQWQDSSSAGNWSNIGGTTPIFPNNIPDGSVDQVFYRAVVDNPFCPSDTSNRVQGTIIDINAGTISSPRQVCDVQDLELTLSGAEGTITWQDSTAGDASWSDIATNVTSLVYSSPPIATNYVRVVVTDPTSTCSTEVSATFTVVSDTCAAPVNIIIANAMTPNNDGANDSFYILNIEYYPNNHIEIFNRWGNKVFEANGYKNDWFGENLPDATYYYLLELGADINGNENEKNKYEGNVTILK